MKQIIQLYYFNIIILILFLGSAAPGHLQGSYEPEPAGIASLGNLNKNPADALLEKSMEQLLLESGVSGGLVVHVGCGTGEQTATITNEENFIIQGLNSDRKEILNAMKYAGSLDRDGRLSFRHWDGSYLPYTDNLVNLLFWSNAEPDAEITEIMRVLVPNGVAYIKQNKGWKKVIKPWPDEIDEWPHYRYDPGSTGASKDERVGPPDNIQWEAGPRFMRSHEIETGISSIVSTKGRLFYIVDEGPLGITDARFPAQWSLVCRDAFNGILLWKRPLPNWGWQAWKRERENHPLSWQGTRTRPADVDRLMVADGDTLYLTLGFGAPISAIDGATGEVLITYQKTEGMAEFIFLDGILLVRNDSPVPAITAVRAYDGKILWQREAGIIMDRSLCAAGEQVFFHSRGEMVSLDLKTGEELWNQETELRPAAVIAHRDAVLIMQSGITMALSSHTGEILWQGPGAASRGRYPDIFVIDDIVWSGRPDFNARQIKTGEILKKMELQKVLESGHHRRCYTDRATINYMITGERGSEFLDLHGGDHERHNWVRGPCVTGMVPANGLFYSPPHQCFCYPAVKLDGFFALGSRLGRQSPLYPDNSSLQLEKGPAYGHAFNKHEALADEWPTYRKDAKRSGSIASNVPADLDKLWTVRLGGNLTQAVVAGEKVFVVQKDEGTLHCLDLNSGENIWSKTVSARIDSPPSLHNGFVFFGSRDGFVYSLRASDGELAWRFRAAPEERQIVSYGRLESPWPAHGSVLIHNGLLYCSAGRSGFLDGGIYLYALDPDSGEVVHQNKLEGPFPDISQPSYPFHKDGYRSDLLTANGRYIYMGRTMLDGNLEVVEPERISLVGGRIGDQLEYRKMPEMRLVATGGFLNQTFWNRTWWMHSHIWPGFMFAQQAPKSGQMLVFDKNNTYTVKHYTTRNIHSPMLFPGNGYLLFADDNDNEPLLYRGEGEPRPIEWESELPQEGALKGRPELDLYRDAAYDKGPGFTRSQPALWTSWVDVRIEAMVLANENLFIAGTPDIVPEEDPLASLEGRMGGIIKVVEAKNGRNLAEYSLESKPVFDGLIAVQGRLIITTQSGEIICMGQRSVAGNF